MTRKDEYDFALSDLVRTPFKARYGQVVPESDSLNLKDGGVYLDAVYLYADMADSSGMARRFTDQTAAKIVQAYLSTASRILRHYKGEIRSFDGDRVMAIFIGDDPADRAVSAALEIRWAVDNLVHPKLSLWIDEYDHSSWNLSHRCGLDVGTAFIVRGGVRNNNDLVSIGEAPNVAAKLSDRKGARTWITSRLYGKLSFNNKFTSDEYKDMWPLTTTETVAGRQLELLGGNWGRVIG